MLSWIFTRKRIWRSKDFDLPVTFIKKVGTANGIEYAQVEYDGSTSFVPSNELFRK